MNKKNLFFLGLIVLISSTISFCVLTRGQTWLDDFASYIMQAKSILNGTMAEFVRRNAFTVNQSSYPPGPAAYPWGFPLLLSPVYAVFGMNALALKLVNTLFFGLFLIVFFGLARTRLTDVESLLLTAALAFNPALLLAHDQILSDIPFLFFCALGIFLIDRFTRQMSFPYGDAMRGDFPCTERRTVCRSNPLSSEESPRSTRDCHAAKEQERRLARVPRPVQAMTPLMGIAIGAVIFAANFIRTNGILLLIPLALAQWIQLWPQRRNKTSLLAALKPAIAPYLTFGLLFAIQTLTFPDGQSSYLSHFSMFTPQHLWDNFIYYFWLPSSAFDQLPVGVVLYPLLLIFVIVSAVSRRSRDLPIHAYSLATIALFILWPERQGLRFIYPILPFLFIFAFDGMKLAAARLKTDWRKSAEMVLTGFWLVLTVISLGVSFTFARDNLAADRAINGPFDPVSTEMFAFVREKIPAKSVVIFFKPRAMRLFTDRDSFMTERCADFIKGDYLALSEKVGDNGQIPPEEAANCNPLVKLEKVFHNKRFTVYKINQ